MKQIVAHKKLSALQGVALVLGLLALLVFLNYVVLGLLSTYVGNNASSLAFWALGGLIAWAVLRIYIVKYSYELGDEVLRLNRMYGKRERHIEDIYLNRLLAVSTPEEVRKRYPNAKRVKAVHIKGENPVTAVVYRDSTGTRVALIQPDDAMRGQLVDCLKKNK